MLKQGTVGVLLTLVAGTHAIPTLFAASPGGTYAIRTDTWQSKRIAGYSGNGLAANEAEQRLYTVTPYTLYTYEYTDAGGLTFVTSVSPKYNTAFIRIDGLAHNPLDGQLYGSLVESNGYAPEGIYRLDPNTGAADLALELDWYAYDFKGFDVDPGTGMFYAVNDDATPHGRGLFSIDVLGSGAVTLVAEYPNGESDIDGLAVGNGRAWLITDSIAPHAQGPLIYSYDLAQGMGGTFNSHTAPWQQSGYVAGGAYMNVVPEPATFAALGLGVFFASRRRRSRRKANLGSKTVVGAVLLMLLVPFSRAQLAEKYIAYELVDPDNNSAPEFKQLNQKGQILGKDNYPEIVWDNWNIERFPGLGYGERYHSISNYGVLGHAMIDNRKQAVLYKNLQEVIILPEISPNPSPLSINDNGLAVLNIGGSLYYWSEGGGYISVPHGGYSVNSAPGINNSGAFVGTGGSFGAEYPLYWKSRFEQYELGNTFGQGKGIDIDENGVALIRSRTIGQNWLWSPTGGSQEVFGQDFVANALNIDGLVVGQRSNLYPREALVWDQLGGVQSLQPFIEWADGAPWFAKSAIDVNDRGQILVMAGKAGSWDRHFVLYPVPEPTSIIALAAGLGAIVARRRWRRSAK